MNLRDLGYFEIAAEMEHLGRAAATIALSQPALTKAIHRLETAVGGSLFERFGRGVRLTPTGQVLLGQAKMLRAATAEAKRRVTDFAQGSAGLVRIGSGSITLDKLLPNVCTILLAQAPKVQIIIEVGASMELLDRLREKKLDLVLGLLPDFKDPELQMHPILHDDFVVAARQGHPVFKSRRITLESLLTHQWALANPTAPSRQWLDAAFSSRGLPRPTVQIEANSIPLLPRLIAGTDLISFVSRLTLTADPQSRLREVKVDALTLHRRLGLTSRRMGYLSPAAERLVALLQAEGPSLFTETTPQLRKSSAKTPPRS